MRARFRWGHFLVGGLLLIIPFLCWAGYVATSAPPDPSSLSKEALTTLPFGYKSLPEVAASTLVAATFLYSCADGHSTWVSPCCCRC